MDGVEIFFYAIGEDELHIGLRFVIGQKVQFVAVELYLGKLVLCVDTVVMRVKGCYLQSSFWYDR